MSKPSEKCVDCKICDKACPANGSPSSRISNGVPANRVMDCLLCYECNEACPVKKKEKKKASKSSACVNLAEDHIQEEQKGKRAPNEKE